MPPSDASPTTGLFVRLPVEHARRLDQAANALPAHKKDLVRGLVDRYVHPDSPEGLDALRDLTLTPSPRRVTIDLGQSADTVGRHQFHPSAPAEVLDSAQAAELLAVAEEAVVELATRREIPGRQIAGEWRFSRAALLAWLGGVDAGS
jgi:excisionase family DNA binding protein